MAQITTVDESTFLGFSLCTVGAVALTPFIGFSERARSGSPPAFHRVEWEYETGTRPCNASTGSLRAAFESPSLFVSSPENRPLVFWNFDFSGSGRIVPVGLLKPNLTSTGTFAGRIMVRFGVVDFPLTECVKVSPHLLYSRKLCALAVVDDNNWGVLRAGNVKIEHNADI